MKKRVQENSNILKRTLYYIYRNEVGFISSPEAMTSKGFQWVRVCKIGTLSKSNQITYAKILPNSVTKENVLV